MGIATDYMQTYSTDKIETVMYMSEDSIALIDGAPRSPTVPYVLDLCCGSGVQGIVALRYYASDAVFRDLNPRSLQFTRFNLFLNGLEKRGQVYIGNLYEALPPGLGPFDAILVNPPFVPNPKGTSAGASAMFGDGGDTGERVIKGVMMGTSAWLKKGTGRLTMVSHVANVGEFPERLQTWYGSEGKIQAAIVHGTSMPAEMYSANPGHSLALRQYQAGLRSQNIQTIAESLIFLWPMDTVGKSDIRVVNQCQGLLWQNKAYLRTVCQ